MRTAVLIHGCHLGAQNWDDIVWGDPARGRLGRVPKGLIEALRWQAEAIIFSTGASQRDGVLEGEVTLRHALARIEQCRDIAVEHGSRDLDAAWLQSRAVMALNSTNTREEIVESAGICRRRGIGRLILVSSPTHIMRCHQAAISTFRADPALRPLMDNLYAVASHTCYDDATEDDVAIVEPPHRGDLPNIGFHRTIKGIFPIMRDPVVAAQLNQEMAALIRKHTAMLSAA